MAVMPTNLLMHAAASHPTQHAAYCRFCELPIRPGTGVMAAPRLSPHEQLSEPRPRMFGTPERCHTTCVPASYRLDERF